MTEERCECVDMRSRGDVSLIEISLNSSCTSFSASQISVIDVCVSCEHFLFFLRDQINIYLGGKQAR